MIENLPNEIWKDIEGYEGIFQVSNKGRVKSLERVVNSNGGVRIIKERIRKPQDAHGYLRVRLKNGSTDKNYFIHRLVANTFIPNPNNLPQVNHKDENPQNNIAENLEWCTHIYNQLYGTRIERIKVSLKQHYSLK